MSKQRTPPASCWKQQVSPKESQANPDIRHPETQLCIACFILKGVMLRQSYHMYSNEMQWEHSEAGTMCGINVGNHGAPATCVMQPATLRHESRKVQQQATAHVEHMSSVASHAINNNKDNKKLQASYRTEYLLTGNSASSVRSKREVNDQRFC